MEMVNQTRMATVMEMAMNKMDKKKFQKIYKTLKSRMKRSQRGDKSITKPVSILMISIQIPNTRLSSSHTLKV